MCFQLHCIAVNLDLANTHKLCHSNCKSVECISFTLHIVLYLAYRDEDLSLDFPGDKDTAAILTEISTRDQLPLFANVVVAHALGIRSTMHAFDRHQPLHQQVCLLSWASLGGQTPHMLGREHVDSSSRNARYG